jgi:hypothetical protein
MRAQEEIDAYAERVSDWIVALLQTHTPVRAYQTTEDFEQLDRDMAALPARAKKEMTRLFLQKEVLDWVLNTNRDDLVADTREKVEEAGVDMYELEDRYDGTAEREAEEADRRAARAWEQLSTNKETP